MTKQQEYNEYYEYQVNGTLLNKKTRKQVGQPNEEGYIRLRYKGTELRAHRVIWTMINGDIPEGMLIDHIDGIKSNNRIENLRLATRTQNNANKKHNYEHGLPKGIVQVPSGRFRARLYHKGVNYSLGTHDTVEEAELAYNTKAKEIHGEFAYTTKNLQLDNLPH